ncbi:TetR/AcrR family transcriptional regulator [Nonomuraea jiangxiensis]|uniref:DNA-binding transcriptional regulator, AcrR family n=1 Tax=Nonomuraea jiangxiensis TaxID=633440 RepID=A0A1G8TSG1_9ACTN|nr:TetR/AcrR family transcriptional regulator [Nonomuraea jiangxiensis]SDJ44478.1 DNA-binding transcriptional regulator, AcrR family [Nonomuraea jiangxiensis]
MSIQTRKERERAQREKLIITAARELAEAEGWEAVTTRRLAEQVEYSQPVLYSHFKGKDAIMTAVALEGFADLAAELRAARTATPDPAHALAQVGAAYVAFAERRPALYDAMFSQTVNLPFATPQAPAALHTSFNELAEAVGPHAHGADPGLLTETFWAALHGLVTLMRGGRLPREAHDRRLAILLARFTHEPASQGRL